MQEPETSWMVSAHFSSASVECSIQTISLPAPGSLDGAPSAEVVAQVELEEGNSVSATLPEVDKVLEMSMLRLGVGHFQTESLQEPRARLQLDPSQRCHHLA